jgi:hypothetical protein
LLSGSRVARIVATVTTTRRPRVCCDREANNVMRVTVLAWLLMSGLVGSSQETFRINGVVRDNQGGALPGAEITISGGQTVVADVEGRFELSNLAAGAYDLRARLAGFRAQSQQVRVGQSPTTRVTFVLPLGMLAEVMHITPEPREAYRRADAIAHIRIMRQLPPLPCSELGVVSALHEGAVLSALKGALPTTIHFFQDSAGTCVEGSTTLEGMGERAYSAGSEYILFLVRVGDRFDRIAGGSLAFPVRAGSVFTHEFMGLPEVVSLDAFRVALQELAREPLAARGCPSG